jgi:hypothetical protein
MPENINQNGTAKKRAMGVKRGSGKRVRDTRGYSYDEKSFKVAASSLTICKP